MQKKILASKRIYKIVGMDCANCATMLECDLEDVGCKAKCLYAKGTLEVDENDDFDKIKKVVEKSGYKIN